MGDLSSFLYGWMQIFIARPGSQAAAAMAFAIGLNDFLDNKLAQTLGSFNIAGMPFEFTTLQLVALMVIVIFTTLNCASVILTGQIATILTFVKMALIVFVAVGAFVLVSGDFVHFSMMNTGGTCEGVAESITFGSPTYTFVGGFAAAMLGALWGYDGWNNLTFVAGEVKDPNRNIPIAIIGSTLLIIVLYVFAHVAYFYVLDPTTIASRFEEFVGCKGRRQHVLWRKRREHGDGSGDCVLYGRVDALVAWNAAYVADGGSQSAVCDGKGRLVFSPVSQDFRSIMFRSVRS